MKKVIFLDFDGVMDTEYYDQILISEGKPINDEYGLVFDPSSIRNLKRIVEETYADIVVTSTWKYMMSYADILDMWKARELPGFVTDVTPNLPGCRCRGDEIDAWLEDCKDECQYVILDDLGADNFHTHQIPWLLVVNPYYGIDEVIADRAISHLSNNDITFDYTELRNYCLNRWPKELGETHGVEHWDRVARFGKMLYQAGVDMDVVTAFAYLHDSERKDNCEDINHGKRASKLIDTIRASLLIELNDKQIMKLKLACELHTVKHRTGDITIDACFDADRMDLLRVGIKPSPDRMATLHGADLVSNPKYEDYYREMVDRLKDE